MVMVDGQGIPIGGTLASASPTEVRLVEKTLETVNIPLSNTILRRST
jgi:hypothetical protein